MWERTFKSLDLNSYLVSECNCDRDPHSEGQSSFYLEKSQDEGLINPHIIKSPP